MDDKARPHRSRAVTAYLRSEAVTSVPWPAMNPDLNPIEHIWDMLGRRIQNREPPVQNIRQLEAALHREWQQLSQQDIRRPYGFTIPFCHIIYTKKKVKHPHVFLK
jgi:transposase